ncbi:hypothetical protein CPC08DRAFT_822657 [Agrocybe pediades]|nr:hypothetical protein CPC08DRAFT_822657 [Agrocybe pediades]
MSFVSLFPTLYQSVYSGRYAHLAAEIIVLYDHGASITTSVGRTESMRTSAITFDQEVDLIWAERWTAVKVLFLMNRYYGLAAVLVDHYGIFFPATDGEVSRRFQVWQAVTELVINFTTQGILQLRIYALHQEKRLVLFLMLAFFAASFAISAVVMGLIIAGLGVVPISFTPDDRVCVITRTVAYGKFVWVPMFLFEGLLCALVVAKGWRTEKPFGSRLADVIFRDSIIYFAGIGAIHLLCFLIWALDLDLAAIPLGFAAAIPCVMSNRLILNLRSAARIRTVILSDDTFTKDVLDLGDRDSAFITGPISFAERNPDTL